MNSYKYNLLIHYDIEPSIIAGKLYVYFHHYALHCSTSGNIKNSYGVKKQQETNVKISRGNIVLCTLVGEDKKYAGFLDKNGIEFFVSRPNFICFKMVIGQEDIGKALKAE